MRNERRTKGLRPWRSTIKQEAAHCHLFLGPYETAAMRTLDYYPDNYLDYGYATL